MENPDLFLDEYIDTLGLENPMKRDPGSHRGNNSSKYSTA